MRFMRKTFNHTVSGHRNAAAHEKRRTLFSRCRVLGLECSLSSRAQTITNQTDQLHHIKRSPEEQMLNESLRFGFMGHVSARRETTFQAVIPCGFM